MRISDWSSDVCSSDLESSTRSISNPNRCHAVTYFAYQINKTQVVRFKILAITRRVIDPAGDSKVAIVPPRFSGEVAVIPQSVLATDTKRVAVESVARASAVEDRAGVSLAGRDSVQVAQSPLQGQLASAGTLKAQRTSTARTEEN